MLFGDSPFPSTGLRRRLVPLVLLFGLWRAAAAAELEEGRKLLITGDYDGCVRVCEEAARSRERDEEWPILWMKALLATGHYPEAQGVLTNALARYRSSIRVLVEGREVALANGDAERARSLLDEINDRGGGNRGMYRDPPNLVALGRAALLLGAEPRLVLDNFYDQAKKTDPKLREAWLAGGDLALDKEDFGLAAKIFGDALKQFPDDPDVEFGLARAYAPSARPLMLKALEAALSHNPNHVAAMLLLADHAVDGEDFEVAGRLLEKALAVNPWGPEAWAYRAVLAHLRNRPEAEGEARDKALKFWGTNPAVDHLIGRKLSQKYRFAEGSACQRKALQFDAGFLPARMQLAQDLLRLGQEDEGWQLADEVHQRDGYDVTAYNLVTLRDTLAKFETVTNQDFILRMSPREAALYGPRALDLLGRAKEKLSAKYGFPLERRTTVEIFPEQKDFAVRTFGIPENPGFLGVCFGPVITANSPASQAAHPSSWEAVLWHEFCHVITLGLTRNRMPRWLSEGISVYEELQANSAWGQSMTPRYREMILGEDLTPVSKLSAAFLSPKSDLHVQFAYYESALVVEFLVGRFGFDSLKQILRDLGDGADINQAIAAHSEPMEQLEKDFAAFARDRAGQLGPALDWTQYKPVREDAGAAAADLLEKNPTNYWALADHARRLMAQKKWEEATVPLKKLIELCPACLGANNAYSQLAEAERELKNPAGEREALNRLAAIEADASDAFLRLMELGRDAGDWPAVLQNADRFLAVNPLLPQPYRFRARAAEELGKADEAIDSYRKLLLLDPPDPADVHFRLARVLQGKKDPAARREVLQALEEAPRFREAHRLLLEIAAGPPPNSPGSAPQPPSPK